MTAPESRPIPDRMRAVVLDGVGFDHIALRSVPTPRPGPRQLLARVDAAGICTSLIKIAEQGPSHRLIHGWDVKRFPLILGDEGSLTIVEVGDALADRFRIGDRYVAQPAVDHPPINHRERYRDNGRGVTRVALGYTLAGHLAEYMLVTEEVIAADCLVPIPPSLGGDEFPSAHAALSEPFSCCVRAQDHHAYWTQSSPRSPREVSKGLRGGGVTVVVGVGAMGRMHVDLALSYRPAKLLALDFLDERLRRVDELFAARARKLGVALETFNAGGGGAAEFVRARSDGRGADDVIVAVGLPQAIEAAQGLVARGGVLNAFGGLRKGNDIVPIDMGFVHYNDVVVTGTSGGTPWDVARTLELMEQREIDAGAHIARVGDLDHSVDFLRMVRAQELDGKAVVYPHRRLSGLPLAVRSWSAEDERSHLRVEEARR